MGGYPFEQSFLYLNSQHYIIITLFSTFNVSASFERTIWFCKRLYDDLI